MTDTEHTLVCQREYAVAAASLWQIVSDFYSDWHPFIEQCTQETPHPIRRFTMPGSKQVYREQLIFYSDSLRCLRYEMLEGISGVERYRGGLQVEETHTGCLLRWWADIEGDTDLVEKITGGTEGVFLAGFDVLEVLVKTPHPNPSPWGRGALAVDIPNDGINDKNHILTVHDNIIYGTASHPLSLRGCRKRLYHRRTPSPQPLSPRERGYRKQALKPPRPRTFRVETLLQGEGVGGEGGFAFTTLSLRERGPGGEGTRSALTHHHSPKNKDWLCLFLHGIGGNRSNWDFQLPAVAELMPCAALDLRGYGDSQLGQEQTTIDDYCTDIQAVVKHFGVKHLVLAGLSYGSWIATHFALHYPDELAGLVLCGGCTGMSEAPDKVRQGFLKARLEPLDAGQTPADFADNVVSLISGPQATDQHRSIMRDSMAAIPAATYRDALHCFTHPPGRFDFGQLACPALLLTGEHDKLAPPTEIAGVAKRMVEASRPEHAPLPDIRFEIISGAGHIANLEQPEAYNQVLLEFLQRITQSH